MLASSEAFNSMLKVGTAGILFSVGELGAIGVGTGWGWEAVQMESQWDAQHCVVGERARLGMIASVLHCPCCPGRSCPQPATHPCHHGIDIMSIWH